jgi:hypothetical protein
MDSQIIAPRRSRRQTREYVYQVANKDLIAKVELASLGSLEGLHQTESISLGWSTSGER